MTKKNLRISSTGMQVIYIDGAMSQKLCVNDFKWETSQFNENLIKSYNDNSDEGIFLKLMFNIFEIESKKSKKSFGKMYQHRCSASAVSEYQANLLQNSQE